MNKVMVIGCCGSGKSTLSRHIQNKTGLPLIHLDREYYKPGWERPAKDEWEKKVLELCGRDRWIMDGNYISSMDIRMQYADTLIRVDVNRVKCLYRAVFRVLLPSKRYRTDMGEGCEERHDLEFYRFIWNFNKTIGPKIDSLLQLHKGLNVITVKNNRDINRFLSSL